MMDTKQRFDAWLADPQIDAATKDELKQLAHREDDVYDRFCQWLEFGTAGLRGQIGAGANRMNIYTVRLATQALADVLRASGDVANGVVIAFDCRRMSREFADEAAAVLNGNGIPVHLFSEVTPTPVLSFAVRHLRAGGGIVITASHNPPQYNGYKVYGRDGGQLLAQRSKAISDRMATLSLADVRLNRQRAEGLWHQIGEEIYQAYFQQVQTLANHGPLDLGLPVLYTPLHGTGGRFVPRALHEAGFKNVDCVPEQLKPDGEFPTIKTPNPESALAFEQAFALAGNGVYQLIIATDPDADRVGVAVWDHDRYHLLNGNQIGVLLADFLMSACPPDERPHQVIVKTIVTTEMVRPLAEKYGVELRDTLTGFKYIAAQIESLEEENKRFLFGFEESYGYLAGSFVRDKDAVLTSLLLAQMAAHYKLQGLSLVGRLQELMEEHGYYLEGLKNYVFATSAEFAKAQKLVAHLRTDSPPAIGGEPIRIVRDYSSGTEQHVETNEKRQLGLPMEDVLQWETQSGCRVTIRPSGTEPKMKLYIAVSAPHHDAARMRLEELTKACDALVSNSLQAD